MVKGGGVPLRLGWAGLSFVVVFRVGEALLRIVFPIPPPVLPELLMLGAWHSVPSTNLLLYFTLEKTPVTGLT